MSELLGLDVMARHCHRGMLKASITKMIQRVVELEHKLDLIHTDGPMSATETDQDG